MSVWLAGWCTCAATQADLAKGKEGCDGGLVPGEAHGLAAAAPALDQAAAGGEGQIAVRRQHVNAAPCLADKDQVQLVALWQRGEVRERRGEGACGGKG